MPEGNSTSTTGPLGHRYFFNRCQWVTLSIFLKFTLWGGWSVKKCPADIFSERVSWRDGVEQHSLTEDYENLWKFTGHELDKETGMYYAGARYYNPKWSIWLSVDPLAREFPGWSPYNYTLQNPVRYVDPDGRAPIDPRIINFIQTAVNNLPKNYAQREYNSLVNRIFGFSERTNNVGLSSSLNDNRYTRGRNAVSDNYFSGRGSFNFFGTSKELNYEMGIRNSTSLYKISSYSFKGNEKGPHLYGGGPLADHKSGFFLEFNIDDSSSRLPVALLQFDSYEQMKEIMIIMTNEYNKELDALLAKDPLVREFKDLVDFQENVLRPLYRELINCDIDPNSDNTYNTLLKDYNTRRREFDTKKEKMRRYYE